MDRVERIERRLKLNDLRILLSVAQAGTMHKAAECLGTSQPAVSRSISDLEHALGVRLFDRNRRGVQPTPYGRVVIQRSIAVFDELRQGIKSVEFLADPSAGELRIGCAEMTAAGPALAVMDRLRRQHPRIAFDVVTGSHEILYRNLAERSVEIVMIGLAGAIPNEFVAEHLFDDSLVVTAGSQNPWARRRRIELADLVNEPWTLPPHDSDPGMLAMEAFRKSGLEPPRIAITSLSLNLRIRLLTTGRYLSMLAGYALTPPSKYPSLTALPVKLPNVRRSIVILTLRNRTLSPLAELFIKTARDVAKQLVKGKR